MTYSERLRETEQALKTIDTKLAKENLHVYCVACISTLEELLEHSKENKKIEGAIKEYLPIFYPQGIFKTVPSVIKVREAISVISEAISEQLPRETQVDFLEEKIKEMFVFISRSSGISSRALQERIRNNARVVARAIVDEELTV